MGWFQSSCGFAIEILPRTGHAITSASHLHTAARLDGSSTIERMEEIAGPPSGVPLPAVGDQTSASVGMESRHFDAVRDASRAVGAVDPPYKRAPNVKGPAAGRLLVGISHLSAMLM